MADDLDPDNPLAVEIMAERASAYFARTRKVLAALSALRGFDETHGGMPLEAAQSQKRGELVAEAAEQVWFFVIQREAMRLPVGPELFADFEIPDEIRKQMGPNNFRCKNRAV